MICLVTGALRGGKTSYAVGLAVKHIAKGGTVFTNVEFFPAEVAALIRKRNRVVMRPEQIRQIDLADNKDWNTRIEFGVMGSPVLIILDEIHLFFNSRDWAKTQKLHADMLAFLSQSGKCFVDIIFIAQVATTLEKQFRDQCELEYYCRSMKTIKIPILGTLPFNKMLLVERDKATDKALSRSLIPYDKEIWKCYNSFAFLDNSMRLANSTVPRIERLKLEKVPLVSRSQCVALCLAALLVGLYFLKN